MFTLAIRIKKLLSGDYPLSFLIYKFSLRDNEISDKINYNAYRFFLKKRYATAKSATLLDLETYDGLGQTCHPSVIYYKGKYILAVTPFPYGNELYENPSLYESKNGVDYAQIKGCQPVVSAKKKDGYLSDPCLFIIDGKLNLLYRECLYSSEKDYIANFYVIETKDLKVWSTPQKIFTSDRGAMSPVVVNNNYTQYVYYVLFDGNETALYKSIYKCLFTGAREKVKVEGIPDGLMLWHIDFFEYKGGKFGLFVLASDYVGNDACLYMATEASEDRWKLHKRISLDEKKKKFVKTYKSCAISNRNGGLDFYISVKRFDRFWGTYLLRNVNVEKYL